MRALIITAKFFTLLALFPVLPIALAIYTTLPLIPTVLACLVLTVILTAVWTQGGRRS